MYLVMMGDEVLDTMVGYKSAEEWIIDDWWNGNTIVFGGEVSDMVVRVVDENGKELSWAWYCDTLRDCIFEVA